MVEGHDESDGSHRSGGIEDFVNQLRAFADRAVHSVSGVLPSRLELPSPPGALSAAQIRAVDRSVSAQRMQIAAVIEQLTAVDEQLSVLHNLLRPLVEWGETWANLEKSVIGLGGRITGESKTPDT
ncbi:MAG TPA: hypothetical protein VL595_19440 [Pseudonocardia sp.]|jgi:hypothetical protein|nr:hypothetical protein [Pseudonocardia sp.]